MKLSIIIPYYEGAAKIGKGLDSILAQGWKKDDYEVILVDDCSPTKLTVSDIPSYPPPSVTYGLSGLYKTDARAGRETRA